MARVVRRWTGAALVMVAACAILPAQAHAGETTATTPPAMRLEDDHLRLRFSGSWRSWWGSKASGATWMQSAKAGSAAAVSFEGTGVALVSSKGPDRGRAYVYVDRKRVGEVDLYAPAPGPSRVVWRSEELTSAVHDVRIVVRGKKSAASSGKLVIVDALAINGRVTSKDRLGTRIDSGSSRLARSSGWWTASGDAAFGRRSWRTSKRGSAVVLRFRGTGATWVGRKNAASGKAEVLLDGRRVAVVSQYRASTASRRVAWAVSGLPYGEHTVVIRALGKPSTGKGTRVDVDAFLIKGSARKAYLPTPFSYPWSTYIVIDKSDFRLYWVRNGLLVDSYPIAHGKWSTPTPSRVWRIDSKYVTDASGVYGPRKMRLYRQVATSRGYRYEYTRYGIHGTNQPWVIGTRASHGCIRMFNRDVLEFWPQVPLGTMVVTRD